MLLAVDIGNTNLSYAEVDDGAIAQSGKIAIDALADLETLWSEGPGVRGELPTVVLVASVNPRALAVFTAWATGRFGTRPRIFREDFPSPAPVRCDDPSEVGADRILAAYGAWCRTGRRTVVVDFGTAITVDLVSDEGSYCGGLIVPGIELSARTLYRETALLPHVRVRRPLRVVGTNTVDAIQGGIFWGFAALVDGLIERIAAEVGGFPAVVGTGGDAALIASATRRMHEVVPHLVLEGLVQAARKAGVA